MEDGLAPNMQLDQSSFLFGLAVGFVIASIGGIILGRINLGLDAMRKPDRPMSVPTKGTPRDMMRAAAAGFNQCLIWSIALVGFVALVLVVFVWMFAG